jgi:exonuclease SbcC
MRIVNLKLNNFLTFKELDYNFVDHPVLIQGLNETDDSQESNGSGKSSIQAGIEYALFKTTSRKVRDVELIHYGENEASIQLSILCPIRGETLVISRTIRTKGSSSLSVEIPGRDLSVSTVGDGDKIILDWIGISKDDLQNYYIINKERYKSFFSSSNTEKIGIISRFSKTNLLDGIDLEVKKDVTELEKELKLYDTHKTSSISRIRTLKEQLDNEYSRDFDKELEDKKNELSSVIDDLKASIDMKKEAIPENKAKIKEIEKDVDHLQDEIDIKTESLENTSKLLSNFNEFTKADQYIILDEKTSNISQKQEDLRIEKKKNKSSVSEVEDLIDEINRNLKGAIVCPKCRHEFLIGDADVDVNEEREALKDAVELNKKLLETVSKIDQDLTELDLSIIEIDKERKVLKQEESQLMDKKMEIKRRVSKIEDEIRNSRIEIDRYNKSIKRYGENIEDIENSIKQLHRAISDTLVKIDNLEKGNIDERRVNELNESLRVEGKKLRDINHQIKRKKIDIFETSEWVLLFKKFNAHLANQSLKVIQGYCNKFMKEIGSDIQIKWEGVKVLADGKLKDEISSYILRDGEERSFWSFSGGERGRMDYSMILALQEMINKTHKYGGLSFLSTDEICEGIDGLGLSSLMKSLSELDKTILVTTHVVNRNVSDKILLVRKVNGVSTIE